MVVVTGQGEGAIYVPRKLRFHGIIENGGWHLKIYSVAQGDIEIDSNRFQGWRDVMKIALPAAGPDELRPGLGFIILHQAQMGDYLVICWWDNWNELPVRVYVSKNGPWREANERESFCVWDMEIIAHERDAYIQTMMRADPSRQRYLASYAGDQAPFPA